MYLPPHFEGDREQAAALIRQYPFASLISVDATGLPYVTHLPLHLETCADAATAQTAFMLLGHVARGNPHWRYLQARSQAVVTFLGPHAYLSPRVYPDLARVPSWNYIAVHCTVQATLVEEPQAKDRILKKLIGDHEPAYAEQWRGLGACRTWGVESENRPQRGRFLPDLQAHSPAMGQKDGEKWTAAVDLQPTIPKSDRLLGEDFAQKMLAGIVAFELEVTGLQCKVKLNQHRPEARSAMRAIYAAGGENEQALAVWMDSLNADAAPPSRQAG